MELTKAVVNHIIQNYKGNKVFIGDNLKKHNPEQYNRLASALQTVPFKNADTLIEHDVLDYAGKNIVITDSKSKFPPIYGYKMINKQAGVAAYYKLNSQEINPHLIANVFRLNYNKKLFDLNISKVNYKKARSISSLEGAGVGRRLLIVGGGESWQTVKYDCLAPDIDVMVVNYNFEIPAKYMVFTDKDIAENLKTVTWKDGRILIGNRENIDGQADYYFDKHENVFSVLHTGAYAVQVAKILMYDTVYLIGYDYYKYKNGDDYSYKKRTQNTYKLHGKRRNNFILDFDKFRMKEIYNLNPKSGLQKYPFENIGVLYAKN